MRPPIYATAIIIMAPNDTRSGSDMGASAATPEPADAVVQVDLVHAGAVPEEVCWSLVVCFHICT